MINIFKDYRANASTEIKHELIDPKVRKKKIYEDRGFNLSHGKGKSQNKKRKRNKKK